MKKTLMSILTIGTIALVAYAGTTAFFSDEETSTGNTFQAGAIDLLIDSEAHYNGMVCKMGQGGSTWQPEANVTPAPGHYPAVGIACGGTWASTDLDTLSSSAFFNYSDIKPGDTGENTLSITVKDNDAYVCMHIGNMQDSDNDMTEPEGEVDLDLASGELAENLHFTAWLDQGTIPGFGQPEDEGEGDNKWQGAQAEPLLFSNESGPASDVLGGKTYTLADANSVFDPFAGGITHYIGLQWCAGTMTIAGDAISCNGASMGNEAQTDSLTADIHFYAEQSRNNPNFSCANVVWPTPEPEEILVGANLNNYDAPTCNVTVTGDESIQTAVSAAAENSTVCVDNAYTGVGDDSAIRIEVLGIKLAATTRGVDLDVPVVLSNSNVTVTGFDGVIGQAESGAEQAAFYLDNDADGAEISFNTVSGGVGAAILTETGAALAGGLISNNVLSGATQGVYTNPHTGSLTIEYNDIDNHAAGIGNLTGALVRYNEFAGATEAIGAGNPDYDGSIVEFNNFLTGTKVNSYGGVDIQAPNNWWADGSGSQTTGTVSTAPEAGGPFPHN